MNHDDDHNIAVFVDVENIQGFDPGVLIERLEERGRILLRTAYADWGCFPGLKRQMLESAFELIEMPIHASRGKNSADIKLVIDALETAMTKEYIDTFAILAGDSDYTPLLSKLRELNKYVIVIGNDEKSTSSLLDDCCDEFFYYADFVKTADTAAPRPPIEREKRSEQIGEIFRLLWWALALLKKEGKDRAELADIGSLVRELEKGFSFHKYGYTNSQGFKTVVFDAESKGLVVVEEQIINGGKRTFVSSTSRFDDEAGSFRKPASFDALLDKRRTAKEISPWKQVIRQSGIFADMGKISVYHRALIESLQKAVSNSGSIMLRDLFRTCRQECKDILAEHLYSKMENTLIQAGTILRGDGTRIISVDETAAVSSIRDIEEAAEDIAALVRETIRKECAHDISDRALDLLMKKE